MKINLIPMAGVGRRFSEEGYTLPKPLIPVSGVPMVIKAIRDMPDADKWIFIVRHDHILNYRIDELIKNEIKDSIIVSVNKTTQGQACTCLLAEKYIHDDDALFISACDIGYLYDIKKYNHLINNKNIGSVFWTFTNRYILEQNATAWGWCIPGTDKITIKDVSVKVPISAEPINDHAIVSAFYFKRSKYFFDATKLMIKNNFRTNNEFYIDNLPIFLNKLNIRTVLFDVDLFLSWGTPANLYEYQYQEYFYKHMFEPGNMNLQDRDTMHLWKQYFNKQGCMD